MVRADHSIMLVIGVSPLFITRVGLIVLKSCWARVSNYRLAGSNDEEDEEIEACRECDRYPSPDHARGLTEGAAAVA